MGDVLYHANYFHLYEEVRESFLESVGVPYFEIVAKGAHLAIVETSQKFNSPILYGDTLEVFLWVERLRKTSFKFCYQIKTSRTDCATLATTSHAFVEKNSKGLYQAKPLPKELFDALLTLSDKK